MYATDSTVLYPPSMMSLISRAVKPLTPYACQAVVREISLGLLTSSAESGVGAPGPPALPSSYPDCDCSSSALILIWLVQCARWREVRKELYGRGCGV